MRYLPACAGYLMRLRVRTSAPPSKSLAQSIHTSRGSSEKELLTEQMSRHPSKESCPPICDESYTPGVQMSTTKSAFGAESRATVTPITPLFRSRPRPLPRANATSSPARRALPFHTHPLDIPAGSHARGVAISPQRVIPRQTGKGIGDRENE